jgi:hypothetical protein
MDEVNFVTTISKNEICFMRVTLNQLKKNARVWLDHGKQTETVNVKLIQLEASIDRILGLLDEFT